MISRAVPGEALLSEAQGLARRLAPGPTAAYACSANWRVIRRISASPSTRR